MRKEWQPSKNLLGGYRCVEHLKTTELSLIGRYGEIWSCNSDWYRAIILSPRIAKRFLQRDQWPVEPGDEIQIKFPAEDLPVWINRLQVPSKPSTQGALANQRRNFVLAKSNTLNPKGDILSLEGQIHAENAEGIQTIAPVENHTDLASGTKNQRDA